MSDNIGEIRHLNDLARRCPQSVNATWVITQGVLAILRGKDNLAAAHATALRVNQLRTAIATFAKFTESNDPYGEHDFGAFELFGAKMFWKIDYFHPEHDSHAPIASNIELCRRVLTVMLAEEY